MADKVAESKTVEETPVEEVDKSKAEETPKAAAEEETKENGAEEKNGKTEEEDEEKEETENGKVESEKDESDKCCIKRKSTSGDVTTKAADEATPEKKAKLSESEAEANGKTEVAA